MKKIMVLFWVLGVALSGCVTSDKGNDDSENGSGGIISGYVPGKLLGSSYTWKSTRTDSTGGPVTSTYMINISDTVTSNGNTYYLAHYDSGKLYNRFRIENDGFYITADGTMYGLHEDGYPYGNPPDVDYRYFDFGSMQGVERTFLDWGSQTDNLYVNYYIKGMYLGPASATVPVGVFDDCRQFKVMPSIVYTPKVSGNTVSFSRVEFHWFAKGIGPVKRVIEIWYNGKLHTTITEELLGYTIPE